jgi:hypothetical protein
VPDLPPSDRIADAVETAGLLTDTGPGEDFSFDQGEWFFGYGVLLSS